MTIKVTKYGLMIIAAVVLIMLAFAGAASADNWTDFGNFNATWYEDEGGDAPAGNTYHIYDNLSLAALSEKVTLNSTTEDFEGKIIIIMNDIELSGHDWMPIGNNSKPFNGDLIGNEYGKSILNVNVTGSSDYIGLIGYFSGNKISNLTISNFNMSGHSRVGGLVGVVGSAGCCTIENCTAEFGKISTNHYYAGGLIGVARSTSLVSCCMLKNCTVKNSVVTSLHSSFVGGLIGKGNSASSYDRCTVVNCSISGNSEVGGLIGYADPVGSASGSYFMNDSSVTNCIISACNGCVGGLAGYVGFAAQNGIKGCMLENSTIVARIDSYVGGLIGNTNSVSVFNTGNKLKVSAIRGKNSETDDYVGEVIGYEAGSKKDIADYTTDKVARDGLFWLNNNSNDQYPKIYIAKSTDANKQGPETPSYFNDTMADYVPACAKLVTQLTGYGPNGQYAALAYVYPTYKVTVDTVEYGSFSINPNSGLEGTLITVTATNNTGYHLNWTYYYKAGESDQVGFSGSFNLPAYDVNISGDFKANISAVVFYNETNEDIGSYINTYDSVKNFTDYVPTKSGYTPWWNVSESGVNLNSYVSNDNWVFTGDNSSVLHAYVNWTQNPPAYTPSSSSKQTGSTIILQEGQVAPTQQPTVAPTVVPTEQTATPTVIQTVKPTTQPTQSSPAPLAGLIAGLGTATLVLARMRR